MIKVKYNKLILLMPLRSLLFILSFVIFAAVSGKQLADISNIWSVAASIINIVLVLALVHITKDQGGYLKLINYENGKTRPKHVFAMIGIILLVGMGGMLLAGFICYGVIIPYVATMMIAPIPAVIAIINLVVLPVSTALAEDSLYLGCGVRQFENKYAAIIVNFPNFAHSNTFGP